MKSISIIMDIHDIYQRKNESEVILPAALKDAFLNYLADNGIQFAPNVQEQDEKALFHFLFLAVPLEGLVLEFLQTFTPDDFWATEIAVPNDRVKHTERIAEESNWMSYSRQQGADKTRLCFIRTPRSVPVTELEERVELVS